MRKLVLTVSPIYLVAVLLIYTNEKGWISFKPPLDHLLTEIGIALLAVGSIHILDHIILVPHTARAIEQQTRGVFRESLDAATESIVSDVTRRVEAALDTASRQASEILERKVEAIKVMEETNLTSIFAGRSDASIPIREAMARASEVRLMGISLNEFLRTEHKVFHDVWKELQSGIRQGRTSAKLLLIDPFCHGAVLRSFAETMVAEADPDRLENDVIRAAEYLHKVKAGLGSNASKLDVRFYHLAPSMFLCHLDETSFMQPYYFWTERREGSPTPVLQYKKRTERDAPLCIHQELKDHFDFVWQHASVELTDFIPMPTKLLEWGSHVSGMASVFIDKSRASLSMRQEIDCSDTLLIQGITLNAFFADDGDDLADSLKRRIEAGASVKVLLLDPDGIQAKERAYREFLLEKNNDIDFEEFVAKYYPNRKLVTDLISSIERVRVLQQATGGNGRFEAKKYSTAPHMFCLIGNHVAYVEQYSYGHVQSQSDMTRKNILGSDMPLIEYQKDLGPIYDRVVSDVRARMDASARELRPQPYLLLQSHFNHAWKRASPI
jgi:hypothetical protein